VSTTLQGPRWWIASDGLWYPPETHPEAQAAAAPAESGWWIASDGLWYPPETLPDTHAPPAAPPDAPETGARDPLPEIALPEDWPYQPRITTAAPRWRGGVAKAAIAVTLVVAACVTGLVVTSGGSRSTSTTAWTNKSLHVVGTPVAGDGRVLLLSVTPKHDLQLAAVNPTSGSVKWTRAFSPSGITPGVQFGPVIVQNTVLDLEPAGNAKDPGVYLRGVDVQTGRVAWSVPQPVEATDAPVACNNDHDFCVTVWDTQTTTALVAIDAIDGQPVFSVEGPARNVSQAAPGVSNSGGIWQTSDSTPTFTWVGANGNKTWSQSVATLFGGSQYGPDNGYDLVLQGALNVGSVGVAPNGSTTPLGESKTLGIRSADGSVAWSVPGLFLCGGSLQFLSDDVVCQFSGTEQSSGRTETVSGGMVLRGLDPATGALTWSRSIADPTDLILGQNIAFSDGTHFVVRQANGTRVILDTENGSLAPVASSQIFWCEQTPLYKVNASADGSANGQRASAPVFATCTASGARTNARPPTRASAVGVKTGSYFVWPSTDGLHGDQVPSST
jgi:hypothetical protein